MIYKLTSVKSVIAKVFTDLDLKEETHRVSDMIEWAGDALEKIGAFPYFVNKVTGLEGVPLLEVANYQCKLPCDFYSLIQMTYSDNQSGPYLPMRYSTGHFETFGDITNVSTNLATTPPESDIVTYAMEVYDLTYAEAITYLNTNPDKRVLLASMLAAGYDKVNNLVSNVGNPLHTTDDITYVITSGYIKCNVRNGYIMMAYQAIPTDCDGYPMIPDDISFKEAIYWYINMKLMYPKWAEGRVRDAVYYDARRSWNFYCKQAYGDALMPNADKLESIKNAWVRLIPEIREHSSGFSTLGQEQFYYNHN